MDFRDLLEAELALLGNQLEVRVRDFYNNLLCEVLLVLSEHSYFLLKVLSLCLFLCLSDY